jgi:UrcA family protein
MSRKPLTRLALAAALLLTGVAAPAAFAETEALSTLVHYGDLDLTQKAGVDQLVSRLNRAAETVCPSFPKSSIHISAQARTCRREAVAKAVADFGSPELAARLDPITPFPLASR